MFWIIDRTCAVSDDQGNLARVAEGNQLEILPFVGHHQHGYEETPVSRRRALHRSHRVTQTT